MGGKTIFREQISLHSHPNERLINMSYVVQDQIHRSKEVSVLQVDDTFHTCTCMSKIITL